jgi:hypothetical protein
MLIKIFLAAGFALVAAQAQALTMTHAWELNGTTADTQGGPAITLADPTGLGLTGYTFDMTEGATISGYVTGTTYTMEMKFSFDILENYLKILDFKNFTTDDGFHTRGGGELNWYDGDDLDSAASHVTAGTPVHLVLTRDGTNDNVVLYANGALALSFTDSSALSVFSEAGGVIRLMADDTVTNNEYASGFLDYVRIYSDVATASEALALSQVTDVAAVPVPASLPLLVIALGGLGLLRRRKG